MSRFMAFACTVFLLTGCMIGPDYRRPPVDAPQTFLYEDNDARDTADIQWWNGFEDPALDALIQEALANNKDIKIAAANIEEAAGVVMQTRAQLYPQVDYSGSASRERLSRENATPVPSTVPNPQTSLQLLSGASWEIDLWGRIRRLSEAAQASLFSSREARRGVILSLVASVSSSYIQLRGLDSQLQIARRTLATYGESVKLFELQFTHGQVSQMTLEQARSQYETAAAAIPKIESQIAQTEIALSFLLSRKPGPIDRGKSLEELSPPPVPAGLPSQLLDRRPDLAQAEQDLIAANAQIGAARALYFPTISLTAALGLQSSELSDLFQGPARVWNYAGSFTGPIFTAGAIRGQVKQAEAAQKAALENYRNAILNAFSDVEKALVSHQKFVDQLKAEERLVTSLRNYARLAWLQYNGGYTPYLTVLDAESQLFDAELNLALARTSVLGALINIYKAMGGGWVNEADELTRVNSLPGS